MPEDLNIPTEDPQADDQFASVPGGVSLFAKIRILLFVAVVIAAECLLAWLYLPSASETTTAVQAAVDASPQIDAPTEDKTQVPEDELAELTEVDLKEFCIAVYQPVSGTTLRVDFHLWGMVDEKDQNELLNLLEEHQHRLREQIQFTIRSAEITDLTDARMGLIKRTALERANKTIGKPLLRALIFDDFSLIEQ
jgi:hypothetical protein